MGNNNRGMLLETIINKTINQYKEKNIAIFHKKNLDIRFESITDNNKIKNAKIISKSTVDYYGIYQGKFIAFEAKSTTKNTISKNSFKVHQHNYLKKIKSLGGKAFYIFLFKKNNEFFLADISLINYEKNIINIEYIRKYATPIELIFPGVIDFIKDL